MLESLVFVLTLLLCVLIDLLLAAWREKPCLNSASNAAVAVNQLPRAAAAQSSTLTTCTASVVDTALMSAGLRPAVDYQWVSPKFTTLQVQLRRGTGYLVVSDVDVSSYWLASLARSDAERRQFERQFVVTVSEQLQQLAQPQQWRLPNGQRPEFMVVVVPADEIRDFFELQAPEILQMAWNRRILLGGPKALRDAAQRARQIPPPFQCTA